MEEETTLPTPVQTELDKLDICADALRSLANFQRTGGASLEAQIIGVMGAHARLALLKAGLPL